MFSLECACARGAGILLALTAVGATMGADRFWQITEAPSGYGIFEPSVSADGTRVAFRAAYPFAGPNDGANFEIFVYDRPSNTFTQLTETPAGIGNFIPLITPDGGTIVFRSAYDFTGAGQADTFELWAVDVATGVFTQVTNNPANTPVFEPRMSGNGVYLTFTSRINPTGQNADGSLEVFRLNRLTGEYVQISNNATTAAATPDINGDGTLIVWCDRANYDGSNPEAGLEVWLWEEGVGIAHVTQQTGSVLVTELPRIDAMGNYVAFISLYDFVPGPVTGRKLFIIELQTGIIRLLTNPGYATCSDTNCYTDPVFAPDGTLYFEYNRNPTGGNPDNNRELFRYDFATDTMTQLTTTTGGATLIQLSDDALRYWLDVAETGVYAFRSEFSLDPDGPNDGANIELYLGAPIVLGDVDCDGDVDFFDIDPFVDALNHPAGVNWPYPCPWQNADCDGDGDVDFYDIDPFVALLGP